MMEIDEGDSSSHRSNKVSCHICEKIFANTYRLQRHMLSHEIDPHTRNFNVHNVQKAFKFKHHLKVLYL